MVDPWPLKLSTAYLEVIFPRGRESKVSHMIQSLFPRLVKLEHVPQLDRKESLDMLIFTAYS